ncbi:hypothetical protein SAMN04487944_1353 [Gracilibacillus ureilyticus]|uniref:PrcB C-terminal domain-containing protein n=1 Tax=Gracilibacillus ureilyticus TaxID=531814 RepID=A0A1H9W3Y8_9BACI|nr:hypothetical protein [Gracilibacillus ureilyticus]SES28499.1 hypothetical protein SAMN04487944_1353 [Gracilibacillus ureilyticus]
MRRKLKFIALAFLLLSVLGCNQQEEQDRIDAVVIASEKRLPANFEEIALKYEYEQVLVEKVEDYDQYQELWELFQLKEEMNEVDLETNVVLFIGLYESGSCPEEIKEVTADSKQHTVEITFENKNSNCMADASPRTFVLSIDNNPF